MSNDSSLDLLSATQGFDKLFADDLVGAKDELEKGDSPYHLVGLGIVAFLQAALGLESELMPEATRCLSLAERGCAKEAKLAKSRPSRPTQFPQGIEWEILRADAVVLGGLTQALSESYLGYLQAMYALNNAHGTFSKIFKTVFPNGLDDYVTPSATPTISRKPSSISMATPPVSSGKPGFFGKWGSLTPTSSKPPSPSLSPQPEGPIDEFIVSGAAFGFGLFNLIFSLLPAKVRNVVGWFGFQSDRKLALHALAVAAVKTDSHAVFAGLTLMTYHGVVLLMSGWQADSNHILRQYRAIVDSLAERYPTGSLWILNKAKILRMSHDADAAIKVLEDGLAPGRTLRFKQADALLVFELAWTLLAQRRFAESAKMFLRMTEMNSWSHATYYTIAAGCYISLNDRQKARSLFDKVPELLERKKIGGKDLPTEVWVKNKIAFYKEKQRRRGGSEEDYVQSMMISPAEELAIFWNTHARLQMTTAEAHARDWMSLSPPVTITSPFTAQSLPTNVPDLDTPDEIVIRSLLLGIVHRTAAHFDASREFLSLAVRRQDEIGITSKWTGLVATYELAILELKQADHQETDARLSTEQWRKVLKSASDRLDQAAALSKSNIDLSSRLDMRISMLRDEISNKTDMLDKKN